jgi:hypothetical protein
MPTIFGSYIDEYEIDAASYHIGRAKSDLGRERAAGGRAQLAI